RPIQTMQGSRAWIRMERRRSIQPFFDLRSERIESCTVRAARTAGRHHSGLDLTGDFFPGRRILRDIGVIHAVEHEPRGLGALVVTADGVLVGKRVVERGWGLSVKSRNGTKEAQEAQESQG